MDEVMIPITKGRVLKKLSFDIGSPMKRKNEDLAFRKRNFMFTC